MSSLARLTSGSAAAWARIGVTFATQIALVPVFLSYWDQEMYGVWLAIQAVIGLSTLIDIGHQTFVGYEFLKLGKNEVGGVSRVLSASIPMGIGLGTLELLVVAGIVAAGGTHWFLGYATESHSVAGAGTVLILQSVVWLVFGSVGGIFVRALAPFGYYPRMGWWAVLAGVVTSVAPVIAVMFGAKLLGAGIALAFATVAYNVPMFWDVWRLMQSEGLRPVAPEWKLGFRNLMHSSLLTLKSLLEMARQQGARLILSPMVGAAEMAAFATMRTGANVALQGLGTVTNPLMPELMHFIGRRDQPRMEAAFGTIWITALAMMAPAIVLIQLVAPLVFPLWTRGKIAFDPILFALLSLGVLVYALAQPAMAVVQGNNLLRAQTVISAITGGVVVFGMAVLVPICGLTGAAAALLLAEIGGLVGYAWMASDWLKKNELIWPHKSFIQAVSGVVIAGFGTAAIALRPQWSALIVAGTLLLLVNRFLAFWNTLPDLVKSRAWAILESRLPAAFRKGS